MSDSGGLSGGVGRASRIYFGGHSFISGYQSAEGGQGMALRLAALRHAEPVIYGHTSALLAQDDSGSFPGGYATIINSIRPRTQSPNTVADRTAAPYVPNFPVSVFFHGVNDLAKQTATTATNVAWLKMALRAITCYARLGGVFVDTHGSVAFSAGWSASSALPKFGSPTSRSTTTDGSTVTITVPADFPGGEVDIFLRSYNGGGGKWSTVVDGGAAQVLDGTSQAYGTIAARGNLLVQRLTGLAAGAHTIVVTMTAHDAGATGFFDSWGIVAPDLPTVVLCNHPSGSPGFPWTGTAHTPVTTADVQAMNVAIGALPAEFTDGNVVLADMDSYFAAAGNGANGTPGGLYLSDGIHLNDRGQRLATSCLNDTINRAPVPARAASFGSGGIFQRQIKANGASDGWAFGSEPALGANWAAFGGGNGNWFGHDRAGNTTVQLDLVRTGAPALNEVIFFLTPGYAPASDRLLSALSWNAGSTVATPGLCVAKANGNVQWLAGDPTTRFQVSGVFPADGLPNN